MFRKLDRLLLLLCISISHQHVPAHNGSVVTEAAPNANNLKQSSDWANYFGECVNFWNKNILISSGEKCINTNTWPEVCLCVHQNAKQ